MLTIKITENLIRKKRFGPFLLPMKGMSLFRENAQRNTSKSCEILRRKLKKDEFIINNTILPKQIGISDSVYKKSITLFLSARSIYNSSKQHVFRAQISVYIDHTNCLCHNRYSLFLQQNIKGIIFYILLGIMDYIIF